MSYLIRSRTSPLHALTILLAVGVIVLLANAASAVVVNSTYGGNAAGNWNQPTDWNPNQVPNNAPPDTFNVTFNSGAAEVPTNVTIDKFNLTGGSLKHTTAMTAEITVNKPMTWTSGDIGLAVAVSTNGGLKIGPQGATPPKLDGVIYNSGAATLQGAELAASPNTVGAFDNKGSFSISPNASVTGGIRFYNQPGAKFTKLVGGGITPIPFAGYFSNRGTVDILTGGFIDFSSYEQSAGKTIVAAGAKLQSSNDLYFTGGQLTGGGVVQAPNVINGGKIKAVLAANAKLEIQSNYIGDTGDSTSTFDSAVGGPGMWPDYASLVDVTGNATLGGRLIVRVWPGYTPNPTVEYYIMQAGGSISGYFINALDGQRINTVGRQGSFVVHYGGSEHAHEVTLEDWGPAIVPEPASAVLLAFGLLAFAFRRGR